MKKPVAIVSTDMDGTLLDHHDYSWQAASSAISRLQKNDIPIIFNTSKTESESRALQNETGIDDALIVENGSALLIKNLDPNIVENIQHPAHQAPEIIRTGQEWKIIFGSSREHLLDEIHTLRKKYSYPFEGFSDWSIEYISEQTGLKTAYAELSAQKQFSEPFIWNGDKELLGDFINKVEQKGLKITKGGRFYHVMGQTDKARPLLWLKQYFLNFETGVCPKLICLGDNQNDIQMLEIADFPVCIKSPVSDYPSLETDKQVIYTELYGSEGWNQAIQSILTNEI